VSEPWEGISGAIWLDVDAKCVRMRFTSDIAMTADQAEYLSRVLYLHAIRMRRYERTSWELADADRIPH
jgi:hypothetical protein